ncbi:MAG: hypothetical protein LBJ69_01285 [Holosporales bacterium]|jgi:hypothetical protein|nr:hypothetical protein [Holosporales bacterium]
MRKWMIMLMGLTATVAVWEAGATGPLPSPQREPPMYDGSSPTWEDVENDACYTFKLTKNGVEVRPRGRGPMREGERETALNLYGGEEAVRAALRARPPRQLVSPPNEEQQHLLDRLDNDTKHRFILAGSRIVVRKGPRQIIGQERVEVLDQYGSEEAVREALRARADYKRQQAEEESEHVPSMPPDHDPSAE